MFNQPKFEAAFPFQEDVLALPVVDLDATADWYAQAFGMVEVERQFQTNPTVILARDDVQIGFAINGGDASQEGAAIRVANIQGIKAELESKGVEIGNWRVDERDGKRFQVFFVVAPDGLCYCFNEPI
ncbi:VOC family protein [Acaryochloris marina NIES-2412]|uniref:VOC family protein n=1 Tax=Acaryochloris marina TaxID=155978 RepID=UPI0040580BB5